MNLARLLAHSARCFPDRPALSAGRTVCLDYASLGRRAAALAASLQREVSPGGRAVLAMNNRSEYLEILFGCWHGGLAVAPLNARLNAQELAFMTEDCDARIVFADEDIASALAPLIPGRKIIVPGTKAYERLLTGDPVPPFETHADDLAWIFYTSGTTGKPKGAMLSHGNLLAMIFACFADIDFLDEEDALLHLTATSHAAGLFALSHIAKASNNILPESGGYDPAELAALIDGTPKLSFFVPPTLLRRICSDGPVGGANLANVKTVLVGAAPVRVSDLRRGISLFGPKLWNGYGQGESPCTITAMSKSQTARAAAGGDDARLRSVGVARTGMQVKISDDHDADLSPGTVGEVCVRGPTLMSGYWGRPEETQEALRGGWLRTGDLGRLDGGYLTLLDRKKDMIISGGMNIYAREIEDVLLTHPGVAEAAVIGLPDREWGETVMAVIVAAGGAAPDAAEIDRLCLSCIARYKRPRRYALVEALPRNSAGKVLKNRLRAQYAAREAD